ncbi:MAG: 5-(carboxyamino)imidazole ribonucleotide synthase, partial [Actinobacteria bacterium]|nr:5-(carboxyamino)imidazole ribonucleotide synthase [Actinomycetota bacterium]
MSAEVRTIGVLGGGQLGQMIGLAAIPLGLECVFYDPAPDAPARIAGRHVC